MDLQKWSPVDCWGWSSSRRWCRYRLHWWVTTPNITTYSYSLKFVTPKIDDPQMPGLIPMIKKARPGLPIVYRSHIEIRSDLTSIKGSPQEEVWEYLWKNIQLADLFISHPVSKFVPKDVPMEKVCLLGAATDLWVSTTSFTFRCFPFSSLVLSFFWYPGI